jgi:hypothetical protein
MPKTKATKQTGTSAQEAQDGNGQVKEKLTNPGFPRRIGRFGMEFAPFPRKTRHF